MKRRTSRWLSIMLALCMVLSLLPVTAVAENTTSLSDPQVTSLTVSWDGGEPVDLLDKQSTVSMPVGSKPVFTVTFDNTELLNQVFVTSTKDGETKYLEAILQGTQYVTDGYFDPDDKNYIPGTIAVTYSKKIVNVDESGNVAGTDLNTLKTQLSSQGISIRNETTSADGTVTAQIVLGDMFSEMSGVYFDAAVSEFTAGTGVNQSELNKWLDVYQDLSRLSEYDLESADGKKFTLYLGDGQDFGDADTYLVLVKDVTSNKYTKMLLSKAAGMAGLGDISNTLASANLVTKTLLEYNAISKDTAALREEIEAHPTMSIDEKAEANAKIDALERDKQMFLIGMTAITTITAVAGAPLMISALVAGYSSIAPYFWEHRIGLIRGNASVTSDLAVSGTCGEHLIWNLNGAGTLTISGYGPMTEFFSGASVPWRNYTMLIKRIVISEQVTSIGRFAFAHCYELKSVSIPDTVESIGYLAFRRCYELDKIVIPGSVSIMEGNIFEDCDNLKSAGPIGGNYDIQFGWTDEIPSNAFYCSSIEHVVIPEGITIVGDNAFGFTEIESVQIPGSVVVIGNGAFFDTNLRSIVLPNSVTTIGDHAFTSCTDLKDITLSPEISSIGALAFHSTEYYNNNANWSDGVLYLGRALIAADTSLSGDYTIKSGTTCIADSVFFNTLTSVVIPSSVTHIGKQSFYRCRNLKAFFMGDAPAVYDRSTSGSFYEDARLYYIEGKAGWDIDIDYGSIFPRWHDYQISTWEGNSTDDTDKTNITNDMFTVDTTDATYTGRAITKTISGKDGNKVLLQGTDYTVSYTNNTNVGTATITITGIGDYTGTLTYTFAIKATGTGPNEGIPTITLDSGNVRDGSVRYTITSVFSEIRTVYVTAALYENGGKLREIKMVQLKLTGNSTGTLTFDLTPNSLDYVKVFLLDQYHAPLCSTDKKTVASMMS